MQGAAAVVNAGFDKIGENIISIGCANQLTYGQTQLLCQPTGQDIAEIAGGHAEIHLVAHFDLATAQQVCVGLKIVCNLGSKSADIDRVGGGQAQAVAGGESSLHGAGEDVLHAGLGIVEIALDGANRNVIALLSDHLRPLNCGHAAIGIEHADLHALYIRKACQCSLAGIAGGSSEDQNVLLHTLFLLSRSKQLRQHTQSNVLKCRCRTTEQLQHSKLAGVHGGGQLLSLEFAAVCPAHQLAHIGNGGQHSADDPLGHLHSILLQAGGNVDLGQLFRHIQAAVGG